MINSKTNKKIYLIKTICVFFLFYFIFIFLGKSLNELINNKYLSTIVNEILFSFFIIIYLKYKSYFNNVFNSKEKFLQIIKYTFIVLLTYIFSLIIELIDMNKINFKYLLLNFILCITIGISEELLCRGFLLNKLLDKYGKSERQVFYSILVSSIIFGILHFINCFNGTYALLYTLCQVITATFFGFYVGTIYYKTKSIWITIFIHFLVDFTIMVNNNQFNGYIQPNPNSFDLIENFLAIIIHFLFYYFSTIYVWSFFTNNEKIKKFNLVQYFISMFIILIIFIIYLFISYFCFYKNFS